MTTSEIQQLINSQAVLTTFANLNARWQDEHRYENFECYAEAMLNAAKKAVKTVGLALISGTKRPFGIKFYDIDEPSITYHLILKHKGANRCCLAIARSVRKFVIKK